MRKKVEDAPQGSGGTLSRRQVIVGAATAALVAGVPLAAAATRAQGKPISRTRRTSTPMRRYMASATTLFDGRILVSGGYDRPLGKGASAMPLSSAVIYDPNTGDWSAAEPMSMPRARHAAVLLSDGRVAVLGGIGLNPTASVEIYDPQTNTWSHGSPLDQPRYDHTAAAVGGTVYVLGGSSQSMLSSVEVITPGASQEISPNP